MCQLIWSTELQKNQNAGTPPQVMCRCRNGQHDRWDLVRYEIEREFGMVSEKYQTKGFDSCIIGVRLCDFNSAAETVFVLGEDARMQLIGPVVLLRFPIAMVNGRRYANTFVPNKISEALAIAQHEKITQVRKEEFDRLMKTTDDEDTKLSLLVNFHNNPLEQQQQQHRSIKYPHPSTSIMRSKYAGFINYNGEFVTWAQANPVREPPPPYWVCQRCNNYFATLHYIEDCPSHAQSDWIPMNRRTKPFGIPRTSLRLADITNAEEVATAPFLDDYGKLWIRK